MSMQNLKSSRAAILGIVLFVGCVGNTETTPSSESQSTDTSSETRDATESKDQASNTLPVEFPTDIFVANDPKVTAFKEIGGKKNLLLEFLANDGDDFVKNYQDGMSHHGWKLVSSSKHPIGTISNYSKDDRKCTISISPPEENSIKVAIVLP